MLQILHISDLHLTLPRSVGSYLAYLSRIISPLAHYYTFAAPRIRKILPVELRRVVGASPTVLALTGDIVAWPGDSPHDIDGVYYPYVETLVSALPSGSILLPVLGNHDWGDGLPFRKTTNFLTTRFQSGYGIANPRFTIVRAAGLTVIFFLVDSNVICVPATGHIDPTTLNYLHHCFADARNSTIPGLLREEYEEAVKILLLHHSPLSYSAYAGAFTRNTYQRLHLVNAQNLLQMCSNDVDVFLFGHTHIPTKQAFDGFIVVNGGPTLAMAYPKSSFIPNFHLIRIANRNLVEVDTFYWLGTCFSSMGSKAVTFTRGAASGVTGVGGWG